MSGAVWSCGAGCVWKRAAEVHLRRVHLHREQQVHWQPSGSTRTCVAGMLFCCPFPAHRPGANPRRPIMLEEVGKEVRRPPLALMHHVA